MAGIYIHIPFCKQACSYCNFYFTTRQSEKEQFIDSLLSEISTYRDSAFADESIETIYFGGGTPSQLKAGQVKNILNMLRKVFKLNLKEVTFEMNPDDVTAEYLTGLNQAGITRTSMGIQSFQPELLSFMNRAHTRGEALHALELLYKSSFQSFTVDLIYGNPGQTRRQLLNDIDMLMQFEPPHISAYSLTVEPKTRLGKQVELNRVTPPGDDKVADQFEALNGRLKESGLSRYEVSNYSKEGSEAVHNSNYWNHQNYLGLGPGAHSFWWDDRPLRWKNVPDLKKYPRQTETETLSMQQAAEERIMMGLRTREGVSMDELSDRYDYDLNQKQTDYLSQKEKEGKLNMNKSVQLTDAGILIADAVILDLVTLHD